MKALNATEYSDGFNSESARIAFLENRDGEQGAIDFAERTICIYHNALANKDHHLTLDRYRSHTVGSIDFLERYLTRNNK